jgi:RHS repeat-associated protein
MVTDANGNVLKRYDYLPFGEELTAGTDGRTTQMMYNTGLSATLPDVEQIKFTSKERDAETGLDFFNARYFSSAQGRFSSADPAGIFLADVRNPQTWNLYTYGLNSPLVNIDPSGLTCVTVTHPDGSSNQADDGDGQGCKDAQVAPTSDKKPPTDASDVTPQQANVRDKQGSLLAFLLSPPQPPYVENDKPLSPGAQRAITAIANASPTICGGGVFGFLGAQGKKKGVTGFAGGVGEYDSNTGLSGGGLFEAGRSGKVGGGAIAGPSGTQGIIYAPVFEAGVAEAGLVGFTSGVGVYGEVGRGPVAAGAGAYLNVTTNAGCASLKGR